MWRLKNRTGKGKKNKAEQNQIKNNIQRDCNLFLLVAINSNEKRHVTASTKVRLLFFVLVSKKWNTQTSANSLKSSELKEMYFKLEREKKNDFS